MGDLLPGPRDWTPPLRARFKGSGGRLWLVSIALTCLALTGGRPLRAAEDGAVRILPAAARVLADRLERALDPCLEGEALAGVDVGVHVGGGSDPKALYAHDADRLLIPASTVKLIVSAAALDTWGPDFHFETLLAAAAPVRRGVVEGDLFLVGRGDPCLSAKHLDEAAQRLRATGVLRVRGAIAYDVSYMDREEPRYAPNARHHYAPPCALTVEANRLRLAVVHGPRPSLRFLLPTSWARLASGIRYEATDRPGRPMMVYHAHPWGDRYTIRGTVTRWDEIHDYLQVCVSRPGRFAAVLLGEACQRAGIAVEGGVRESQAPRDARTLLRIRTGALSEAVATLHQESSNVIAEVLVKDLGAHRVSPPGTRAKGLALVRDFCTEKLQFAPGGFRLVDACGLALENRLSASHLGAVLRFAHGRYGEAFVRSLPRLGHHPNALFPKPPPGIEVFLKSGTLPVTGVNAAAGYVVVAPSAPILTFAVLANRRGSGPAAYSGTLTQPVLAAILQALTGKGDGE